VAFLKRLPDHAKYLWWCIRYLGENSKLVETMSEKGIPQQAMNQLYGEFPSYW
jgi:hypothetical protein